MSAIPAPDETLATANVAGRWALLVSRAALATKRATSGRPLLQADRTSLRALEATLRQAIDTLSYIRAPRGRRPAGRLAPVDVAVRTIREASKDEMGREDVVELLTRLADQVSDLVDRPEEADPALADLLLSIAEDAAAEGGSAGDLVITS